MTTGFPHHSSDRRFRVVSWNLLRRVGAGAEDVVKLVQSQHPDLLLLQECTEDIIALPSLVGGHFFRHPTSEGKVMISSVHSCSNSKSG